MLLTFPGEKSVNSKCFSFQLRLRWPWNNFSSSVVDDLLFCFGRCWCEETCLKMLSTRKLSALLLCWECAREESRRVRASGVDLFERFRKLLSSWTYETRDLWCDWIWLCWVNVYNLADLFSHQINSAPTLRSVRFYRFVCRQVRSFQSKVDWKFSADKHFAWPTKARNQKSLHGIIAAAINSSRRTGKFDNFAIAAKSCEP